LIIAIKCGKISEKVDHWLVSVANFRFTRLSMSQPFFHKDLTSCGFIYAAATGFVHIDVEERFSLLHKYLVSKPHQYIVFV
jgi:hypothetical protein